MAKTYAKIRSVKRPEPQELNRDAGRSGGELGACGHSHHWSAGGPRPQHVARSKWSGTFLSLSTSSAAADRAFAAPKWLRPRRRDGPRSGGGGFMRPGELHLDIEIVVV